MNIKTIYEFLLWDNCQNKCKFCFQRKNPRLLTLEQQAKKLNMVYDFINSSNFKAGNHILLVGGELFDDQKRKDFLRGFFINLVNFIQQNPNHIDLVYVNTNLIFPINTLIQNVFPMISQFNRAGDEIFRKLRFATSYDIEGRFKDASSIDMFLQNIKMIHQTFPKLNIVTNMILTNKMCDAIVNRSFDVIQFMKDNQVDVNLIPYIILDRSLAPTRKRVFDTLQMLYDKDQEFIRNWLINIDIKQPRKMFFSEPAKDTFLSCECGLSECGHSENFKLYSDSSTCFVCDVKERFNSIL